MNKQERESFNKAHGVAMQRRYLWTGLENYSVIINYNPSPTNRDKKVNTYLSVM